MTVRHITILQGSIAIDCIRKHGLHIVGLWQWSGSAMQQCRKQAMHDVHDGLYAGFRVDKRELCIE